MKKTHSCKIVFIVGPTASGKTDLAFYLASKFSGSLVNADSIQVYRDLDIVSGKDIPQNLKFHLIEKSNIFQVGYYVVGKSKIYLLDAASPDYGFNVSDFAFLAKPLIEKISKENLPIVVGGTGLYVKSLISDIETINVPLNKKLRQKLLNFSLEKLKEVLKKEDLAKFNSLNNSDINNPRRLVRAIEVAEWNKRNKKGTGKGYFENFEFKIIGLRGGKDLMRKKIDERVDARIKMGALDEVSHLFERYDKLSPQVKNANGYKQLFEYLLGKIDIKAAIERWKYSEYKHAKNQMTWFLKDKNVQWFDVEKKDYKKKVEEDVSKWLSN